MKQSLFIIFILALAFSSTAQSVATDTPKASDHDVLALTPWELLGEDDGYDQWFSPLSELQIELREFAQNFLGCRYVHGGKGPKVFDCSGFTSFVYSNFGYSISPGSRMQGTQGTRVSMSDIQVGDLLFFSGRKGGTTVGHVGMVVEVDESTRQLKFIHASSKRGIVIQSYPDGGYYSKHFLHARRIINPDTAQTLTLQSGVETKIE